MALVHNEFSTSRLFAAYRIAARFNARFTEVAKRLSERYSLTLINGERRSNWTWQSSSRYLPGSVFDPRYKGLSAHAARLDAAICRQESLR